MPVFRLLKHSIVPTRPRDSKARGLLLALLALGWASVSQAASDETVTLWLKWRHQFQFAGYYAAEAKGYYAEEGIDVRIVPGRPGMPALDAVLKGSAQFGVGDSDLVLARLQGKPVVACAAIFQHSPLVVLSRRDRNIRTPSDLVGPLVMLSDRQNSAQLWAMFMREGIDINTVRSVPHTWQLDDLIDGKVAAVLVIVWFGNP